MEIAMQGAPPGSRGVIEIPKRAMVWGPHRAAMGGAQAGPERL